jgi:sporulation protein YunB
LAKFRGIRPPKPKKSKGPLPFQYVFLLSFVLFMFSTTVGLIIVNKGVEPVLHDYAKFEARRVATTVINKAVNQKVAEGLDPEDIVILHKNDVGDITFINTNTALFNRVQSEMVNTIEKNLKLAEEGKLDQLQTLSDIEIEESSEMAKGFIREIPLGQATDLAILGNLGPKVPVKFTTVGVVEAKPVREYKELGINNFLVILSIRVKVDVQVIMPFSTKIQTVENTIPIGDFTVPGEVPQFYNGTGGEGINPSIEISP